MIPFIPAPPEPPPTSEHWPSFEQYEAAVIEWFDKSEAWKQRIQRRVRILGYVAKTMECIMWLSLGILVGTILSHWR